jgi:hypothetical protein
MRIEGRDCAVQPTVRFFLLCLLFAVFPDCKREHELSWLTSWIRTDYELSVAYFNPNDPNDKSNPADEIAHTTLQCPADEFSNRIDWGDGSPSEILNRNTATPKTIRYKGASRTIIDPGRYRFYATSHVYRQLQPYVATISTRIHCLDASRAADLLFPVPVKVHARRAVKEIQVRSPQARGGDTALMKIMLTALAPSSGTRIDLRWAGDTEFLVLPLRTVDVHPFQREVEVAISTKATTITRTVTLTATTIEPGAAASITIRP